MALRPLAGCLLLALVLSPAAPGQEEEPAIPGVSTVLAGRELRVTASLTRPLPSALVARLSSGLPTTTVWRVGLFVFRNLWWDGQKDERRYSVTATYRPVPGDWAIERRLDDRLVESQVVPTRREAEDALASVNGLPCFLMGNHLLGKRLVVKVRCAVGSGLSMGVLPTTLETPWRRSGVFTWSGEQP